MRAARRADGDTRVPRRRPVAGRPLLRVRHRPPGETPRGEHFQSYRVTDPGTMAAMMQEVLEEGADGSLGGVCSYLNGPRDLAICEFWFPVDCY